MLDYNPADAIAARNVESIVRSQYRRDASRRLLDVLLIGQDHGRRTSSVALIALRHEFAPGRIEFASVVVDHASGAVTAGDYYEADKLNDAYPLFALRTLRPAIERKRQVRPHAGEMHACGSVVPYGTTYGHSCEYWTAR